MTKKRRFQGLTSNLEISTESPATIFEETIESQSPAFDGLKTTKLGIKPGASHAPTNEPVMDEPQNLWTRQDKSLSIKHKSSSSPTQMDSQTGVSVNQEKKSKKRPAVDYSDQFPDINEIMGQTAEGRSEGADTSSVRPLCQHAVIHCQDKTKQISQKPGPQNLFTKPTYLQDSFALLDKIKSRDIWLACRDKAAELHKTGHS